MEKSRMIDVDNMAPDKAQGKVQSKAQSKAQDMEQHTELVDWLEQRLDMALDMEQAGSLVQALDTVHVQCGQQELVRSMALALQYALAQELVQALVLALEQVDRLVSRLEKVAVSLLEQELDMAKMYAKKKESFKN